jgi:protein-tyrosine phosphatase
MTMVDLHSHILPALDDGAGDWSASIDMARAAVDDGISTIVATPHVNFEYSFELSEIAVRARGLRRRLAQLQIPLTVAAGGEVAVSRLADLTDAELRAVAMGEGAALLVESPYAPGAGGIEEALFHLQLRGFRPILAHPERCPHFQSDPDRLAALVERGIHTSVSCGSMVGAFGSTVRRSALELLRRRLVHSVSSDAHDPGSRTPRLRPAFSAAEPDLPRISQLAGWLTRDAPAALLAGQDPPPRPDVPLGRTPRWRRLARRG